MVDMQRYINEHVRYFKNLAIEEVNTSLVQQKTGCLFSPGYWISKRPLPIHLSLILG